MKDAYYFSHDSNAQQDPKIIRLIMEMKMTGYGIFWSVIEHLRNDDDYTLNLSDCNAIAFQSHCEKSDVERVIQEFELFEISKNGDFYSKSLMQRMESLNIKRDKARASANARWNPDANAMRTHCEGNASKVKESTLNKDMFERFYSKYPKKQGRAVALKAFLKISPNDELLEKILRGVEIQSQSPAWAKEDGKYIPMPATWLNGQRWEDEVVSNGASYGSIPDQKF